MRAREGGATTTPTVVAETLREYGALTRAALRDYLPSGKPGPYLYDLMADYPSRRGKMLRSTLCIATARAMGAEVSDAVLAAVSIELLHNALLIHDDIEDGSTERRGAPTLHELHGVPLALNAGDALTLASLRPLIEEGARLGPRLAFRLLEEAERMAWETAEGQALDIGWRQDNADAVDEAAYLEMVLKKTCWFGTIYPCRLGALIGSRGRADPDAFIRFGFFLGAAFQIQDDLLNLVGNPDEYGKEVDGDIWEGKRTLMLIRLFAEVSAEEREQMTKILDRPRQARSAEGVRWIRQLMDRYECVAYARGVAHGLAGAALHEFSLAYGALPDSRDKHFVEGLATWVFERT